jgi:RimJ/RimL family protein N-acetyltransferase
MARKIIVRAGECVVLAAREGSNILEARTVLAMVTTKSVILETERLILRQFVPGDADALSRVLSDPETMRHYPVPFDRAAVDEWIRRNLRRYAANGHGLWAMDEKTTGEMIGDCGLTLQEVDGTSLPEIGYHLRRDRWGQGFATEAAVACRDYGFNKMSVDFLISLIRPENLPSRRVAERNGMKVWKETTRNGLRHLVYRVTREEWEAALGSTLERRAGKNDF